MTLIRVNTYIIKMPFIKFNYSQKADFRRYFLILFIIFISITCTYLPSFLDSFYWNTRVFIENGFSYQNVRNFNLKATKVNIDEIKNIIPANSTIECVDKYYVHTTEIAYQLYPLKVLYTDINNFNPESAKSNFVFDHYNTLKNIPAGWQQRTLSTGLKVYAKEGASFINKTPGKQGYPFTRIVLIFILISFCYFLSGFIFLTLLNIPADGTSTIWYISNSYITGFLLLTISSGIGLLFNVPLKFSHTIILWMSVILLLTIPCFKKLKSNIRSLIKSLFCFKKIPGKNYIFFLKIIILILITLITISIIEKPVNDGDALSHWLIKAKTIYFNHSFDFSYTNNNEYPVLWPLSIAVQYTLLQGVFDEVAGWTVALLFIAFLSQVYGAVAFMSKNRIWATICTLIYLLFFFHSLQILTRADHLFMLFLVSAVTWLVAWRNSGQAKRYFIMAVISAAGLTLSKLEGGPASVFIGLSLFLTAERPFRNTKAYLHFFVFGSLILLTLAWPEYMAELGFLKNSTHFNEPLSVYKIYQLIKATVFDMHNLFLYWGVPLGAMAVIIFIVKKPITVVQKFFILLAVFLIIFAAAAILFWPTQDIIKYSYTATHRLYLHAIPVIALLLFSFLPDLVTLYYKAEGRIKEYFA